MSIPNGEETHYRLVDRLFLFHKEIDYFKTKPFSRWDKEEEEWVEIPYGMHNYYQYGLKAIGHEKDGATHTYSSKNNGWEALIKKDGDHWFMHVCGNWEELSNEFNIDIIEKSVKINPKAKIDAIGIEQYYSNGDENYPMAKHGDNWLIRLCNDDWISEWVKVGEANHPTHYTQGKVECIDAIESATVGKNGFEAYCVGSVIKYLWRYEQKGGKESVEKAQWYLNKLLEQMK